MFAHMLHPMPGWGYLVGTHGYVKRRICLIIYMLRRALGLLWWNLDWQGVCTSNFHPLSFHPWRFPHMLHPIPGWGHWVGKHKYVKILRGIRGIHCTVQSSTGLVSVWYDVLWHGVAWFSSLHGAGTHSRQWHGMGHTCGYGEQQPTFYYYPS